MCQVTNVKKCCKVTLLMCCKVYTVCLHRMIRINLWKTSEFDFKFSNLKIVIFIKNDCIDEFESFVVNQKDNRNKPKNHLFGRTFVLFTNFTILKTIKAN